VTLVLLVLGDFRTNVAYLGLVELEAIMAMTLVLISLYNIIFSRTNVAKLTLVELVTPQYIVELKVFRAKSVLG
jgi:hypothetical protein